MRTEVINWTRHSQAFPETPSRVYLPILNRCEGMTCKKGTFQAIHYSEARQINGYHISGVDTPLRLFVYDNPDTYHTMWNVAEYYSGIVISPNLPTRKEAVISTIKAMDWMQADLLLNSNLYKSSITTRRNNQVWIGFTIHHPIINQ